MKKLQIFKFFQDLIPAPQKPNRGFIWVRRTLFLGVCALIAWYLPKIDFRSLWEAFRRADPRFILLSYFGAAGLWIFRSLILWIVLWLRERISIAFVFFVTVVGALIDQLIPARGGYVVRWVLLHRRTKISKSFLVSALLASFGMQGIVLLGMFLSLGVVENKFFRFTSISVLLALIGLLLLVSGCFLFSAQLKKFLLKTFFKKISALIAVCDIATEMKKPRLFITWLLFSILGWIPELFMLWCLGRAFGMDLESYHVIILLFGVNLAVVVPIAPANVGTLQLAMTAILSQMGIAVERGLAFSLAFQAVHMSFLLLITPIAVSYFNRSLKQSPS